MANVQNTNLSPAGAELLVTAEDARQKIETQIQKGMDLLAPNIGGRLELDAAQNKYYRWLDYNHELLKRLFTTEEFADQHSRSVGFMSLGPTSLQEDISEFRRDIERYINRLQSTSDRLDLIPVRSSSPPAPQPTPPRGSDNNSVFIVHGHDEGAREAVARFLEQLGLKAVVLHEQANVGQTVIEKLEKHADVGFAVVLLTPDDEGQKKGAEELLGRARQNVILELGYFIGKLGRRHVCALHRGGVEIPSDYLGVLFHQLDDAGGWRLHLAKELKESGFKIDLNKVL